MDGDAILSIILLAVGLAGPIYAIIFFSRL